MYCNALEEFSHLKQNLPLQKRKFYKQKSIVWNIYFLQDRNEKYLKSESTSWKINDLSFKLMLGFDVTML